MSSSPRELVLASQHAAQGARFVPFAGYNMPMRYTSILDEHRAVREDVGVFDVSHMGNFFVDGADAVAAIDRIVTNDIQSLPVGKAAYTVMCADDGGIIDDLIVYKLAPQRLMIIVNAATRHGDLAHMQSHLSGEATLVDRSDDFALLAVQGPRAQAVVAPLVAADLDALDTYQVVETTRADDAATPVIVARTGYTGEDGFELLIPNAAAGAVFDALMEAGAQPIGLGARDTLRLEAKYSLYGQDISRETNPIEAGLGWVVKMDKASDFIGEAALARVREAGPTRRLRGVELRERGVLRPGYPLFKDGARIGELTSGTMSPTLGRAIGLAYVDVEHADAQDGVEVEIRGRRLPVTLTRKPFYRRPRA